MDFNIVDKILLNAFNEDMPMGDITTDSTIPEGTRATASLRVKEDGIVAGIKVCERAFLLMDSNIQVDFRIKDGDFVKSGDIIATISGDARAMLKAERTALNLLQRMSGIATKTSQFVKLIEGTKAKIVDTRKTTPGLRYLEKYAVKIGGGTNHRYCLSDGVLIKDNHIKAAGGITPAIEMARQNIPHTIKIEVETETLDEVKEAVGAGADIIMLDNMNCEKMKKAIEVIGGRAITEASGNVTLKGRTMLDQLGNKTIETVEQIAKTGVDIISVGELTHTVTALDISMKIQL